MREMPKTPQGFLDSLPHCRALGMVMVSCGDGKAVIDMPYDKKLIGDPKTRVVHGGAVSALMDTCCGMAVFFHQDKPDSTATIDLRIDYMRSATPGQTIRAEAVCHQMTRNVAFVRAVAMDEDRGRPVATATGAFTVERSLPEENT